MSKITADVPTSCLKACFGATAKKKSFIEKYWWVGVLIAFVAVIVYLYIRFPDISSKVTGLIWPTQDQAFDTGDRAQY